MPSQERDYPPLSRLILGFLAAPIIPAAAWALIMEGFQLSIDRFLLWLTVTLIAVYPTALLVGIPTYLLLRRYLRPRLLTIMTVAGIIAVIPWLALTLPSYVSVRCLGMIDGAMRPCGYRHYLEDRQLLALIFALGMLGGAVFWLCAVWQPKGQRTGAA